MISADQYQLLVFQFHIGAIKTNVKNVCSKVEILFQFHIGAIKTQTLYYTNNKEKSFQFHIGAIKTLNHIPSFLYVSRVSIPHWCD